MKKGEVIWESENKVSQKFWTIASKEEVYGSREILLQGKDDLKSQIDRVRVLTNIGFSKRN
jgi:hypothetical protein